MGTETVWADGTKVSWHGQFPNQNRVGTLTKPLRVGDVAAYVRWEGNQTDVLEVFDTLHRVEDGPCTCGRCVQPKKEERP